MTKPFSKFLFSRKYIKSVGIDAIAHANKTAGVLVVAPFGPFNCERTGIIGLIFVDLLNVNPNNKSFQTNENWKRNNAEIGSFAIGKYIL